MPKAETPVSLAELRRICPSVKEQTLFRVTRSCRPFPGDDSPTGRRRGKNYLPSEVPARLRRLEGAVDPDCLEYLAGGRTYVAKSAVKRRCGVTGGTALEWAKAGLIDAPVRRLVKYGRMQDGKWAPRRRAFFVKEQIDARRAHSDRRLVDLPKPRPGTSRSPRREASA